MSLNDLKEDDEELIKESIKSFISKYNGNINIVKDFNNVVNKYVSGDSNDHKGRKIQITNDNDEPIKLGSLTNKTLDEMLEKRKYYLPCCIPFTLQQDTKLLVNDIVIGHKDSTKAMQEALRFPNSCVICAYDNCIPCDKILSQRYLVPPKIYEIKNIDMKFGLPYIYSYLPNGIIKGAKGFAGSISQDTLAKVNKKLTEEKKNICDFYNDL